MAPLTDRLRRPRHPRLAFVSNYFRSRAYRTGRDLTEAFARRSALVLAPHPDDETLACGATILHKRARDTRVRIAIATDGPASSGNIIPSEQLSSMRRAEAQQAAAQLGVDGADLVFLGFEEGGLESSIERLYERIRELVRDDPPEELLVPSLADRHPDHRALSLVARRLLRAGELACPVYEYPVSYWEGYPWTRELEGRLRACWQFLSDPLAACLRRRAALVRTEGLLERKHYAMARYRSQTVNLTGEADWWIYPEGFVEGFLGSHEIFFPVRTPIRGRLRRRLRSLPRLPSLPSLRPAAASVKPAAVSVTQTQARSLGWWNRSVRIARTISQPRPHRPRAQPRAQRKRGNGSPGPVPTRVESVLHWARAHGARLVEVFPATQRTKRLPLTLESRVHWKFRLDANASTPSAYVLELRNGLVWGHGEAIVTPDGCLLGGLSRELRRDAEAYVDPKDHSILRQRSLPPRERVPGRLAVLSAPAGGGYSPWMFDLLPRLQMLERAGYPLDKIDHFLVNSQNAGYQLETLTRLGVPPSKLIESQHHPYLQADRLLCPSLPGDYGHPPRWACDFLRRAFAGLLSPAPQPGLRLYLNRSRAHHRRVINEPEVVDLLESYEFRNVTLENLPFSQQLQLLSTAEFVCAPHGAGLTNLAFCHPGTRVLEFLSPADVSTVYWNLASELGLVYAYLIGEGERPRHGEDPHAQEQDLHVDPAALESLLQLAESASIAA